MVKCNAVVNSKWTLKSLKEVYKMVKKQQFHTSRSIVLVVYTYMFSFIICIHV